MIRIGVDIGGSKIDAGAISDRGETVARLRIPTPRGDYKTVLDAVEGLVGALEGRAGSAVTIGVCAPGSADPDGKAPWSQRPWRNSNLSVINGRSLQADLEQVLHRPIRIANDGNCFALSEARDGAASGARLVFGLVLGTGVGGGLAIDGRAWDGPNALAGEWGHCPLPWPRHDELDAPTCYCGHAGCIEQWVSGPALERSYHRRRLDSRLSATEIAEAARLGDGVAQDVLSAYIDRLARSLAMVVNLLDPEVIVLGGGLSRIGALYERLPELTARWVFSRKLNTPIRANLHGDASGMRGAAFLWEVEDRDRNSNPGATAPSSGQANP